MPGFVRRADRGGDFGERHSEPQLPRAFGLIDTRWDEFRLGNPRPRFGQASELAGTVDAGANKRRGSVGADPRPPLGHASRWRRPVLRESGAVWSEIAAEAATLKHVDVGQRRLQRGQSRRAQASQVRELPGRLIRPCHPIQYRHPGHSPRYSQHSR